MKKLPSLNLLNLQKLLLRLGIAILAIWAFGFLVLPPLVKHFAAKALSEKFHRTVLIQELRINPVNLSLSIKGLSMLEQGSTTPFFAINELYANLELTSLLEGAPVLDEIQVKSPYLKIVRRDDATYNVDDILAELLKPSESPAKFSINNILLQGGKVEFDDQPKHARHTVSDIQLAIPFLSNLPYQTDIYVKPDFSAKVDESTVHLKGQLKPFSKNRESTVSLALDRLDLARFFKYIPLQQKFSVPSAILDSSLTITFVQPPNQPPSITLSGTAAVKGAVINDGKNQPLARFSLLAVDLQSADLARKHIQLKNMTVKKAELHLVMNKRDALSANAEEIRLTGGTLQYAKEVELLQPALDVTGFRLQRDHEKAPFITIAEFALKDTALDLGKRSVTLGELSSTEGHILLKRSKNGSIDLVELFAAAPDKPAATEDRKTSPPFQFDIRKLALTGYDVHFSDETSGSPFNLIAEAIKIDAEHFSSQKDSQSKLTLALSLNKSGTVSAAGELGINPLTTRLALDVNGIKIKPFQPYFTDRLNIVITDGTASAKGELNVMAGHAETPKVLFNGDASLDRVSTIDKLNEDDLLKWNHLRFSNMNIATQPLRVNVADIGLTDFYARLIIHADGSLNLQRILKDPASGAIATTAQTNQAIPKPEKSAATPANRPKITIAKLTLVNGKVDFTDNFIKPNYDADLTGLGGSVKGLSSDAGALAEVSLKGRVDNQGRLDIKGKINPLAGNLYLDLLANLNDYELPSLTPYSSKYAGYHIRKGKLSFEVRYRIENRKLTAENHLLLKQLTFGDKVESKYATSLPVMLAVALLQDRHGNIELNLPISGSLDDPQFSMGGIIVKAIFNLLSKIVTSPFALIGSLFAGGEELAYLEFDYGKFTIPANAEGKLDNLAKALQDRPALKLDIAGQADPELDREGLKQAMLEGKIKAQKFNELQKKGSDIASVEDTNIEPSEYAKYLAKAYRQEKMPNKPRNILGMVKDLPAADMEKLMLASFQVTDNDMDELISNRAMEAKEYLINVGKVEPERIFIVTPDALKPEHEKSTDKGKLSRVNFSLGTR